MNKIRDGKGGELSEYNIPKNYIPNIPGVVHRRPIIRQIPAPDFSKPFIESRTIEVNEDAFKRARPRRLAEKIPKASAIPQPEPRDAEGVRLHPHRRVPQSDGGRHGVLPDPSRDGGDPPHDDRGIHRNGPLDTEKHIDRGELPRVLREPRGEEDVPPVAQVRASKRGLARPSDRKETDELGPWNRAGHRSVGTESGHEAGRGREAGTRRSSWDDLRQGQGPWRTETKEAAVPPHHARGAGTLAGRTGGADRPGYKKARSRDSSPAPADTQPHAQRTDPVHAQGDIQHHGVPLEEDGDTVHEPHPETNLRTKVLAGRNEAGDHQRTVGSRHDRADHPVSGHSGRRQGGGNADVEGIRGRPIKGKIGLGQYPRGPKNIFGHRKTLAFGNTALSEAMTRRFSFTFSECEVVF